MMLDNVSSCQIDTTNRQHANKQTFERIRYVIVHTDTVLQCDNYCPLTATTKDAGLAEEALLN